MVAVVGCGKSEPSWNSPAAFNFENVELVFPKSVDFEKSPVFSPFAKVQPKGLSLFDFPYTGTDMKIEPENCLESDAFVTRDDFFSSPISSGSDNMKEGHLKRWLVKGWALKVSIISDKNEGEGYLLQDLRTAIEACDFVANETDLYTWGSFVEDVQVVDGVMRVEYKIIYAKPENYVHKGVKLSQQVGRNVVSVTVTNGGLGVPSDFPISMEIEDEMSSLLSEVSEKLFALD